MEVRVGDVIRLKPMTVIEVDTNDDTVCLQMLHDSRVVGHPWIHLSCVEEIISRIETPEETKERLESQVSFWKASAEAYNAEVIRLQNLLTGVSDEQK